MGTIAEFQEMIHSYQKILFFTGAGVSTLSGIPDFRSANGLYNTSKEKYSPEDMLSHSFFFWHPDKFYDFYKKVFDVRKYEPNIVHNKIAAFEKAGKSIGVITQNVDGLHTRAGTKRIVEYHGSVYRNTCRNNTDKCPHIFSADFVFDSEGIPKCPVCGALVKPDITLYEEMPYNHPQAVGMVMECDMMVVCGTSLSVYPANTFVGMLGPDQKLVILNKEETSYDEAADLVIHEDLGKVFETIEISAVTPCV